MCRQKFFAKTVSGLLIAICLILPAAPIAENKPVAPDDIAGGKTISAEQMIELILARPGVIVIDSRKRTEYLKGHIEGAINLLNTSMTLASLQQFVPDLATDIVFYCNGVRCKRSSDAVIKAVSWGYKNVYWYRGGWKEWTDKKLPYITDE
ncbi:MAG: rhodanese-like domain-containing protein [Gammaproteobacteria bacterium]|nr:rhodanese-like domain-containing protein [Gammaproteobacteria bacterium]